MVLEKDVKESQFIVDGKHFLSCARCPMSQKQQYYSHKLNDTALQSQFVITHCGICVHVTGGERAAIPDKAVYSDNRAKMLQTLSQLAGPNVIILADAGYVNKAFLEIRIGKDNPLFNRHRLLVEAYFGRMSKVFSQVRHRFSLSVEVFDNFVQSLAYLTNLHISINPLRVEERSVHLALILDHLKKQETKRRKHSEQVRASQRRIVTRRSESSFNSSFSLDLLN